MDPILNPNAKQSIARSTDVNNGFYIAQGLVPGLSLYRKFGRVQNMTADIEYDVWDFSTIATGYPTYIFPTGATIDTISSDNAGDNLTILVGGLDGDGHNVDQMVTLDGQNKVSLPTPLLRHNRIYNANGTASLGNVYVYENTAITGGEPDDHTKVKGYMAQTAQQSLQGIYTPPFGTTAYLMQLKTSLGGKRNGFVNYEALLRLKGGVFRVQDTHELATTGTSVLESRFSDPSRFPGLTDFCPRVLGDVNGLAFSMSYRLRLLEV